MSSVFSLYHIFIWINQLHTLDYIVNNNNNYQENGSFFKLCKKKGNAARNKRATIVLFEIKKDLLRRRWI